MVDKTRGLERRSGLLDFYLDRDRGRLWLVVPPAGPRGEVGQYLYTDSLLSGMGSNPVGLDRGQLGYTRLVTLRRLGNRLLVEEQNLEFRARTEDPLESLAVRQSFATSVLWAGEIEARDPDGRALVDFTSFVIRDAHGVVTTLRETGQGSFGLDRDRSVVDPDACLAFPRNVEFEALLTFSGSEPGEEVRSTVPSPHSISLVQHHSLLALPEPGYTPRPYDPRGGLFAIGFQDYASPLTAHLRTNLAVRFRLEKTDPTAARSAVRNPIVFYVDRGAPEPVRTALLEGARWWVKAFEEAGFIDAYKVELMPEGAHPLDARYNVIQWVHRATRGWSYGGGVIDPRTGEMLKGHVTLGSLRVRHDRLLFEGFLGADGSGLGGPEDPVQLSLARIRQLSAHEVGHALGLAHNFAASTYGRASVMDYPAPLIQVTPEGKLDFSQAYSTGIGAWDIQAIRFGYTQFPPGTDEAAALEGLVRDGLEKKLLFLSDQDARPSGAAHPLANLWDNGEDPVAGLTHALRVRQIGLANFGERNIGVGRPLAHLEEVLAPLYFHHRYQLDAAAKMIGGLTYGYALRGDGQGPVQPIAPARQREALAALLGILDPQVLDLPPSIVALLLPRPMQEGGNREMFADAARPGFDALGAAVTAGDMVIRALLEPARCARLVELHSRNPDMPSLEEVLGALVQKVFSPQRSTEPRAAEIQRLLQVALLTAMLERAGDPSVPAQVRTRIFGQLSPLRRLAERVQGDELESAHRFLLRNQLNRFLNRPPDAELHKPASPPPGQPIGTADSDGCSFSL